jgi:4-amino-4-deoxychorismate lyase
MLHAFKVIVVNPNASEQADLQYADRGLQYGDGCFTTMYCDENQVTLFNEHIVRLVGDAARLKMFVDMSKIKHAIEDVLRTLIAHNKSSLAIKLLLTRGSGGRGYELPLEPLLHLYISMHSCEKLTVNERSNYRVQCCSFTLAQQPMLAGLKHLNRLEQVLAKHELQHLSENKELQHSFGSPNVEQGVYIHDLVMLDINQKLVEFTAGNLFFLSNGIWHTPQLDLSGVDGIMRKAFIKFLRAKNIALEIGHYTLDDLLSADALIMCNAIKHLVGVSELVPAVSDNFQPKQYSMKPLQSIRDEFLQYLHTRNSVFEVL